MRGRIGQLVEIRIVESAAEEDHGVVAAGAEARCLDVAISRERDFARLIDGEGVRWVVE